MAVIKDRLLQYLDYKGISKYECYKNTGITNGVFSKKEGMSEDNTLRFISYYSDINPEWLLTGNGNMLKGETTVDKDEQNRELCAVPDEHGIPLIPLDAVAGFGKDNSTQVMEYECEKYVIPSFRGAEFLIQVRGDSMYPKYTSGDIVACKKLPLDTFFQWNKVYVIDSEQGVLIKRVKQSSEEDRVTLVSENKNYKPFEVPRENIISLAIVIGVIRLE